LILMRKNLLIRSSLVTLQPTSI